MQPEQFFDPSTGQKQLMTKGSDPRPHIAQLPVQFVRFFNSTYIKVFHLKAFKTKKHPIDKDAFFV